MLPFRSLFLHAWDFAGGGANQLFDWMEATRLNTLCLAATYHHGWFIHPHHRRHRAFKTEGDVCYFHPRTSYYRDTPLRPRIAAMASKTDWLEEVGNRLGRQFKLVAWTVGAHNTTLGLANPHLTLQNVYGDRLCHSLCPSQRAVSEYLKALCRDLAHNYPLWGIQVEAFGWMPFAHGHHHERDLVGLTPLEQELMGLCFCSACGGNARKHGVDFREVKSLVKDVLDGAFREAPQRPKGHPQSMAELESKFPPLARFRRWRKSSLDILLAEIKTHSLGGTDCRLLLQNEFDPALAGVADGFGCASYQQTGAQTLKICRAATESIPGDWSGIMQCFVQLGLGVPKNENEFCDIIQAVCDGGCNGINFYNHSEAPPKMLSWLKGTLPAFAE